MDSLKDKTIFISGPMSGLECCNVAEFARAHALLKELGAADVYDPAVEYLTQVGTEGEHTHGWYMRRCLRELTRTDDSRWAMVPRMPGLSENPPYYDLLVRLPGWEGSAGARMESDVAEAIGIEVRDLSEVVS